MITKERIGKKDLKDLQLFMKKFGVPESLVLIGSLKYDEIETNNGIIKIKPVYLE